MDLMNRYLSTTSTMNIAYDALRTDFTLGSHLRQEYIIIWAHDDSIEFFDGDSAQLIIPRGVATLLPETDFTCPSSFGEVKEVMP